MKLRRGIIRLALTVIAVVSMTLPARAQITTGSMAGTVKDAQGGGHSRRHRHARQRNTGHASPRRSSRTNAATSCSSTSRPDTYTIEVTMPSFKTLKRSGVDGQPRQPYAARHADDRSRRHDRRRSTSRAKRPSSRRRAASARSRSRPKRSRTCRSPTAASSRWRCSRPA